MCCHTSLDHSSNFQISGNTCERTYQFYFNYCMGVGHVSKTYFYHTSFLSMKQYNFIIESTGKKQKKISPSVPSLPSTRNDLSCPPVLRVYSVRTGSLGFHGCVLILFQDTGVGKSSIVCRFVQDHFDHNISPTIG